MAEQTYPSTAGGAVMAPRWRSALVPLVALVALLVGSVGIWLWMRPPTEGSPEATFARDMSAHHTQAIEMALAVRDRSTNAELRQFALDVILTQQAQIGQMQGWLAVWGLPLAGPQPPMAGQPTMMGMATPEQVAALQTMPIDKAEVSYLQLMIRHHQGGVQMAQEALRQTNRPEVVRLASAIVQAQQSEIEYMQQLLAQRGATPLEPMQMPMGG